MQMRRNDNSSFYRADAWCECSLSDTDGKNQTLEFPILQIICISSPPLGRVVKNAEMANWKRMQMNLFLFNFFSSSL